MKHGEAFGGAAAATSDDFEDIGFDDEENQEFGGDHTTFDDDIPF